MPESVPINTRAGSLSTFVGWGVLLCAVLLAGCHELPTPARRSIEDLYLEAVTQSKPEQTLGLHDSPGGQPVAPRMTTGEDTEIMFDSAQSGSIVEPLPGTVIGPDGYPVHSPPLGVLAPVPQDFQQVPQAQPQPQPQLQPVPDSGPTIPDARTGGLTPPHSPHAIVRRSQDDWLPAGAQRTAGLNGGGVIQQVRFDRKVNRAAATGGGPKLVGDIFEQTDIRQAIHSLATQAGASVIIDEQVTGEVTAIIENKTFEQALSDILMPLGIFCRLVEGQYIVCPADPQANLFSKVSISAEYKPLYLSPQELIGLMSPRLAVFVRLVDKRNLMVVEAPAEITERIMTSMQQMDQPVPQVILEAIICVVTPESGFQFGLDWNHALTVSGTNVLNLGITGLTMGGSASPQGINNAFDDFAITSAFVRLLAQEGYLAIRAAPRVMAKDGEEAKINIGRETYFSVQPQTTGNTGQLFFQQNVEKVESGISLEIIPTIRGDTIQVQIEKAEVSEDVRSNDPNSVANNNPYPQINRRTVKTMVNVKDGHSIVIGGLVQKQTIDRESKVPVLGDIPGLRAFFRKTEQQERDVEVVIFISPKIVMPECQ